MKPVETMRIMTETELRRVLQQHFRRFVARVDTSRNSDGSLVTVVEFEDESQEPEPMPRVPRRVS